MAKLQKCRACGKQIAKTAKMCPHCGAKNHKKTSPLAVIVCLIVFFALLGSIAKKSGEDSDGKTPSPTTTPIVNVDIVMDLQQFSQITLDELRAIMGSEGEMDPYGVDLTMEITEKVVHGDIYYFEGGKLEFIILDDKVARCTYNAPIYSDSEGKPLLYDEKENIPLMFGIPVSDRSYKTVDTPAAYRIARVNDDVNDFWVTLMDTEAKTFTQVKVTYIGIA